MLQTARPLSFDKLEFYTVNEVSLWNAGCRLLPSPSVCKAAVEEVFSRLLERPGGHKLTLTQTHSIESESGTREHTFDSMTEITLGRNPENTLVLAANSVSKQHARLLFRDGDYYLEDLGSRMGTFVNKKRLSEHTPVRLQEGDQFSLFPYNFTCKPENLWIRDAQVELFKSSWTVCQWAQFIADSRPGQRTFEVDALPTSHSAAVRVEERWVVELLRRLLGPLGAEIHEPWLTEPDHGFLEFVFLAVLERVQQETHFPFHFSMRSGHGEQERSAHSRGLTTSFTLSLPGASGAFQLFLPMDLIAAVQHQGTSLSQNCLPASIRWSFPLSLGQVELTPAELQSLEVSDVVLFDEVAELLFPSTGQRGWKGLLERTEVCRFCVKQYFERSCRMESKGESDTNTSAETTNGLPNLGQLPVLLHVVLGEKELSLADANGLIPGSIIELETREGDPVDLAINGKRVGKGELVNVEGKLGVKVLSWRSN